MERLLSITGKTSPPVASGGSAGTGQKMDVMKSVCNSINFISSYHCCAICTEMYSDPRALPCLHTFCLRCLNDYSNRRKTQPKKSTVVSESECVAACSKSETVTDDDDSSLSCPLCRREFQLPPEGASGLPRNVFAEDLVAICGISGRVCAPCDTCSMIPDDDDGGGNVWNEDSRPTNEVGRKRVRQAAVASMCCIECRLNLCDRCCKLHRKLRPAKAHRIIAISSKDPPLPPHLAVTSVVGELPEGQALSGIAILDNHIFVVRVLSKLVDVYDDVTFTLKRHLTVPLLHTPQDMAACSVNKCLYITDRAIHCVHRVATSARRRRAHADSDRHGNRIRITNWPVGDWPTGISVTSADGNVVVTCKETRKVKLFTNDGCILRDVILPADIIHPWHAACLPSGQLIVCHGAAGDPVHRVVLLDSEWRTVMAAHGSMRGSGPGQLNVPARLAVDRRGFTVVADFNNARLVLLSPSTLSPVRDFVSSAATGNDVVSSIRCPLRVCLDESRDRLYIGDQSRNDGKWADSRVLILGTCVTEDT